MTLTLSPEAVEQLHAACVGAADIESGGLLIGTREADRAHVWAVTGPGQRAEAARRALQIDVSFMLGVMAGVGVAGVVEVLGRWHKHVAPDLRTSDNDRRGAEAFRQLCEMSFDAGTTYELVVGTDQDAPIGYGAYLCTEHGLERIPCPTSPRPDGGNAPGADCRSRPALTTTSSRS